MVLPASLNNSVFYEYNSMLFSCFPYFRCNKFFDLLLMCCLSSLSPHSFYHNLDYSFFHVSSFLCICIANFSHRFWDPVTQWAKGYKRCRVCFRPDSMEYCLESHQLLALIDDWYSPLSYFLLYFKLIQVANSFRLVRMTLKEYLTSFFKFDMFGCLRLTSYSEVWELYLAEHLVSSALGDLFDLGEKCWDS